MADSRTSFDAMAASEGNTYWYTYRRGGSGFEQESCDYETTVEVVGGALTRRTLAIIGTPDGGDPADCQVEGFVEIDDQINTNSPGFTLPAATMEDMYTGCCELLALTPEEDFTKSFVVNEDGIATECRTVITNCGEDCSADVDGFSGFRLHDFQWGALPQ